MIQVLFALAILPAVFASIPSFGTQTAMGIRSALPDSAFRIRFSKAAQIVGPNFRAQAASVDNFPVLGGSDVQSSIVRVRLGSGVTFPTHTHPRASETLYLQRGRARVSVRFEGLGNPRVVRNVLQSGQVTVFPQGLAHETKCISKVPCLFISYLNSADPGITGAPAIN